MCSMKYCYRCSSKGSKIWTYQRNSQHGDSLKLVIFTQEMQYYKILVYPKGLINMDYLKCNKSHEMQHSKSPLWTGRLSTLAKALQRKAILPWRPLGALSYKCWQMFRAPVHMAAWSALIPCTPTSSRNQYIFHLAQTHSALLQFLIWKRVRVKRTEKEENRKSIISCDIYPISLNIFVIVSFFPFFSKLISSSGVLCTILIAFLNAITF